MCRRGKGYSNLFIWVCFVGLVLISCSGRKDRIAAGAEIEVAQSTFSFDREAAQFDLLSEYKIQPGDVLDVLYQVQTWTELEKFTISVEHTIGVHFVQTPELDRVQGILPDGNISLPYIGKFYVVEKTLEQLTQELQEVYKDILVNPDIYISVPEFRHSIKELKADLHTAPRGLSRLVNVRPDGSVTFPMLGEFKVANRTIHDVNLVLNERYDSLIKGLHVDLFLEKHSGSRVYILGEVWHPGSYQIIKPITVTQAVALASSFKPSARLEKVVVVRKHGDKMVAKQINIKDSAVLGGTGGLFYLQPDDIVYVPQRRLSRWADIAEEINQVIFFRGWGISGSVKLNDLREDEEEPPDEDTDPSENN